MCETQPLAQEEPVDLVAAIRRHFAGVEVEVELPDREAAEQRGRMFEPVPDETASQESSL
jgi:hypothetical protein